MIGGKLHPRSGNVLGSRDLGLAFGRSIAKARFRLMFDFFFMMIAPMYAAP